MESELFVQVIRHRFEQELLHQLGALLRRGQFRPDDVPRQGHGLGLQSILPGGQGLPQGFGVLSRLSQAGQAAAYVGNQVHRHHGQEGQGLPIQHGGQPIIQHKDASDALHGAHGLGQGLFRLFMPCFQTQQGQHHVQLVSQGRSQGAAPAARQPQQQQGLGFRIERGGRQRSPAGPQRRPCGRRPGLRLFPE
uniref:Uncharacterized protein n=1 Tax=Megalodesulfovibrio gigas TaxID=879 RepID=Q8RQ08_MEGGA|nr:unknown [Megalodesulfovibrio gigas]